MVIGNMEKELGDAVTSPEHVHCEVPIGEATGTGVEVTSVELVEHDIPLPKTVSGIMDTVMQDNLPGVLREVCTAGVDMCGSNMTVTLSGSPVEATTKDLSESEDDLVGQLPQDVAKPDRCTPNPAAPAAHTPTNPGVSNTSGSSPAARSQEHVSCCRTATHTHDVKVGEEVKTMDEKQQRLPLGQTVQGARSCLGPSQSLRCRRNSQASRLVMGTRRKNASLSRRSRRVSRNSLQCKTAILRRSHVRDTMCLSPADSDTSPAGHQGAARTRLCAGQDGASGAPCVNVSLELSRKPSGAKSCSSHPLSTDNESISSMCSTRSCLGFDSDSAIGSDSVSLTSSLSSSWFSQSSLSSVYSSDSGRFTEDSASLASSDLQDVGGNCPIKSGAVCVSPLQPGPPKPCWADIVKFGCKKTAQKHNAELGLAQDSQDFTRSSVAQAKEKKNTAKAPQNITRLFLSPKVAPSGIGTQCSPLVAIGGVNSNLSTPSMKGHVGHRRATMAITPDTGDSDKENRFIPLSESLTREHLHRSCHLQNAGDFTPRKPIGACSRLRRRLIDSPRQTKSRKSGAFRKYDPLEDSPLTYGKTKPQFSLTRRKVRLLSCLAASSCNGTCFSIYSLSFYLFTC